MRNGPTRTLRACPPFAPLSGPERTLRIYRYMAYRDRPTAADGTLSTNRRRSPIELRADAAGPVGRSGRGALRRSWSGSATATARVYATASAAAAELWAGRSTAAVATCRATCLAKAMMVIIGWTPTAVGKSEASAT